MSASRAVILAAALALGARAYGADAPVLVAAAADLRFVLDEAVAAYQRHDPSADVRVSYGASGILYSQISNGGPFDLFLSADADYPRKLVELGLAASGDEFAYGVGTLVLWIPRGSPIEDRGLEALADPSVRRVAIANPAHAPYGRAAQTALRALRLDEHLAAKLVVAENVSQAAHYAESGSADAAFISLSLALAPAMRAAGHWVEVPRRAYPRMLQVGIVVRAGRAADRARALARFLTSPEGRSVLERHGLRGP